MLTSQESSVEDDRRPDQAGARPQDRRGRGVLHELQHRLLEGKGALDHRMDGDGEFYMNFNIDFLKVKWTLDHRIDREFYIYYNINFLKVKRALDFLKVPFTTPPAHPSKQRKQ